MMNIDWTKTIWENIQSLIDYVEHINSLETERLASFSLSYTQKGIHCSITYYGFDATFDCDEYGYLTNKKWFDEDIDTISRATQLSKQEIQKVFFKWIEHKWKRDIL